MGISECIFFFRNDIHVFFSTHVPDLDEKSNDGWLCPWTGVWMDFMWNWPAMCDKNKVVFGFPISDICDVGRDRPLVRVARNGGVIK